MAGYDKLHSSVHWILKIAYLNLLWITFTLAGLVVFGLFPSTGAMFAIVQKWLNKEPVDRIFRSFWHSYKKEFLQLNKFSVFFFLIGYVLVYDFLFLQMNSQRLLFLYPLIGFIFIAYLFTLLYFFPVYTRYNLRFFQYIKQSFLIGAASIKETSLIICSAAALAIMVRFIPGIIPVFTGSVLAIAVTWLSNKALLRIETNNLKG